MTFDRRLAREIAPFAAATLLGFAVIPVTSQVDWSGYAEAVVLMIAVVYVVSSALVDVAYASLDPRIRRG